MAIFVRQQGCDAWTRRTANAAFVFAQQWRVGDLVMWDNRCMMHRARRYDPNEVRELHRTTVADIAPTLQQAA